MRWQWLLGFTFALAAAGGLIDWLWPHWIWQSLAVHAVIEAFGAAITLIIAALLLLLTEWLPLQDRSPLVGASLMAMGCMDLFHACVPPGPLFVAFRCLATLLGGLLMAGVWLPRRLKASLPWFPLAVLAATTGLGALILRWPALLPTLLDAQNHFTITAQALNVFGGLGFLAGMLWFGHSQATEDRLLTCICALFGVAGLTFPYSALWDGQWWIWHGYRLVGSLIAAGFLLFFYRQLGIQTRTALRSRETFIRMASHELRNPLMPLLLRLQLAQRDLQAGKAITADAIGKAVGNVQQITALVNGLLEAMQIGIEQPELRPEPLALAPLVREMVDTYQVVSSRHQIHLHEPLPEVMIAGDRLRLGQVLANLLDNAITYTPEGGEITVTLTADGGVAAIAVQDKGLGILPEDQPRIGDRFYRGRNFSDIGISGLGLGLYICQDIIRRHGGRIAVESQPGAGSTFTVYLPVLDRSGSQDAAGGTVGAPTHAGLPTLPGEML